MREFLLRVCGRMMLSVCGLTFVGAVVLSAHLGAGSTLEAAPVTFRYEATVDSISPGASFDSEIDLTVGDVFTGQFTFEPNAGDGSASFEVNQPYAFSLEINGVKLSTAAFETTVRDDAGGDVDCADLSCPSVLDELILDGSGLLAAKGTELLNLDVGSSGYQLRLWASADPNIFDENFDPVPLVEVLDAAEIPSDVGVWNQFLLVRSLHLWLGDGQGGTFSLNATVGQLTAVPEPSTGSLLLLVLIIGLAKTDRKLQTSDQLHITSLKGL